MSHLYPCGESEYPEEKSTSTLVTIFWKNLIYQTIHSINVEIKYNINYLYSWYAL